MGHLLRIVMIHGHLDGIVELNLDGHCNICGTNASGKTTLQRLIPVFYGEQPNKVVPRTRQKFDAFYLPHRNSYLIYEYRREGGNICQVVLTRSSVEGIEYRFIGAPYRSEDYLVAREDGVIALDYIDWANGLRGQRVAISPKLSTTSEYRAVIQNDFTPMVSRAVANRGDMLKLRQMAAQYSLVASEHHIRHMEKLVSAVHAKEGKLDTLKTMLVAIFEEDGVALPVTRVRSNKTREWIEQMRQSMRLAPLQKKLSTLNTIHGDFTEIEAILAQLQPQLEADMQHTARQLADIEAADNERQRAFIALEKEYSDNRRHFNGQISEYDSKLNRCTKDLDDIEQQYQGYQQADIEKLIRDFDAIPQWREEYESLSHHRSDILEAVATTELEMKAALRQLREDFNSKQNEVQEKLNKQHERYNMLQQEQQEKRQALLDTQQSAIDELTQQHHRTLLDAQTAIAELEATLKHDTPTVEEREEAMKAQLRLEQAVGEREIAHQQVSDAKDAYERVRHDNYHAQQAWETARRQLQRYKEHLNVLHIQHNPVQGTLRHFLRHHMPGWEQHIGKVIATPLLEKTHLNPQLIASSDEWQMGLYGVGLSLDAIPLPEHAQEEAQLLLAIAEAEDGVSQAERELNHAEKAYKESNISVQNKLAMLNQAQSALRRCEEEVNYAEKARSKVAGIHQQAQSQRRQKIQQHLTAQKQAMEALQRKQQRDIERLRQQHSILRQDTDKENRRQLDDIQNVINQHKAHIKQLKKDHQQRSEELQATFERHLEKQGIDATAVRRTDEKMAILKQRINNTKARRNEIDAFRHFMRVDWQTRKPELQAQKNAYEQALVTAHEQLGQCETAFSAASEKNNQDKQALIKQRSNLQRTARELEPLLQQLAALKLITDDVGEAEAKGDIGERIERGHDGLMQRSQLREALVKGCQDIEHQLVSGASSDFLNTMAREQSRTDRDDPREWLPMLAGLLRLLEDQQQQLILQGRNLSEDLDKFFTVFRDINRRISAQSRRLSDAVADDLVLEGISHAEVCIESTIDELDFWEPLKNFAKHYSTWRDNPETLPDNALLDALADVADLLRNGREYSFESLLRLELHLNEGSNHLIIRNDRQLQESSSHGMAYLILCKFLLAFTRLLRGEADITIHWPIDEIGTLAYYNVEKIFHACDNNGIYIVGAFPNPESDVLMLFKNRYLIERDAAQPDIRHLKRIQPRISSLTERLKTHQDKKHD